MPKFSENVRVAAEVLVWLEHWPRLVPLLALAERPLLTKATVGVEFRIGNTPLTLIDALTGDAPEENAARGTALTRTLVMRKTRVLPAPGGRTGTPKKVTELPFTTP